MAETMNPSVGTNVVHLFWKCGAGVDLSAAITAIEEAEAAEAQVVLAAMLGHKADLAAMVIVKDQWVVLKLQRDLIAAGFELVDSYVSITEVSEYAAGLPQEMLDMRLYPELPPEGKKSFCFYPMSKRRNETGNWFTLDFDKRKELMYEHGTSGRKFAGRIVQLITASTGLDDFEWGVTLFGNAPDDVKDVVYTLRYDEASAVYAEFGTFYVGLVCDKSELAEKLNL